jgi:hypothetical protein
MSFPKSNTLLLSGKNAKTKVVALLIGFIAFAGLSPRIFSVFANGDGNLHHALHWLVYGYDRIWYHNRAYLDPDNVPLNNLESAYGKLYPTGEKVRGMPVLKPKAAVNSPYVPMVLILQKDDANCVVYDLSGGP